MFSPSPDEPGKHGKDSGGKISAHAHCSLLPISLKPRQLKASPIHVGLQAEPDQFSFLRNCPPTPPLSQHFALSEK